MGRCLIRKCKESNYILCFDKDEGLFVRNGFNGIDPYWNVKGPELLDISITNYCEKECDFCYRASNRHGGFISLQEYEYILQQAKDAGVLQIALGGGNPNQHPQFTNILGLTHKYGIVPSYTTNGQGITDKILAATKSFCGALAVSWYYPYTSALQLIDWCNEYGIKINVHYLLDRYTIQGAIDLLENHLQVLEKINAIVFLNYKPIHSRENLNLNKSKNLEKFFNLVKDIKSCKIGFDSCMISYLTTIKRELADETIEYCEAARFSAFISENLMLYPCSFFNDIGKEGIDLRIYSLQDGWKTGKEFVKMRKQLMKPGIQEYPIEECISCDSYNMCHGGCQIFNINKCGGDK